MAVNRGVFNAERNGRMSFDADDDLHCSQGSPQSPSGENELTVYKFTAMSCQMIPLLVCHHYWYHFHLTKHANLISWQVIVN